MGQRVLWLISLCRIAVGVIATAGFLFALAAHVVTCRGIDIEAANPAVWWLHIAVFPLLALAITIPSLAASPARLSFSECLALVPLPWRVLLALALAYVVATLFVYVPRSGAGAPLVMDGRFFLNDHGIVREVSEAEFHAVRSASVRVYSAVWLYLYLFAAVFLLATRRGANE